MWTWLEQHEALLWWLGISSVVMFFATLLLVPWLIAQVPQDYFVEKRRHALPWWGQHPAVRLLVIVLRNVLGVIVILAGVAMLILPGQGIITIVLGLMLTTFPGKYRFERWLVRRRGVMKALNWIRSKMRKPPLEQPMDGGEAPAADTLNITGAASGSTGLPGPTGEKAPVAGAKDH